MTRMLASSILKTARAWCLAAVASMTSVIPALASTEPVKGAAAAPVTQPWVCDRLNYAEAYSDQSFRFLRPGKGEWLFRDQTDFPAVPLEQPLLDQLTQLRQALARTQTKLVMVVVPQRGALMRQYLDPAVVQQKNYSPDVSMAVYARNIAKLRAAGVIIPDIVAAVNANSRLLQGFNTDFYLSGDLHWSPYGAYVTSLAVRNALGNDPAFASLTKADFVTKVGKPREYQHTYRKEAAHICGAVYKADIRPSFVTTEAAQGSSDLLGDSGVGIVLVGTSFSALEGPNFAGFLKEALHTDVTNYAVSAGGFDGSILSYLSSDDFKQAPPKFLIWETQTYGFKQQEKLPLILGAAQGDCGDRALLKAAPVKIAIGQTQVIELNDQQRSKIKGRANVVVDINAADPRSYHLKVAYTDGRTDRFDIDSSRWQHAASKMIINLPRDGKDLAGVSLVPDQKLAGTVSARVCRAA